MISTKTLSDIHTVELAPKPPVLRGSPLECSINDVEWEMCEEISPINSYIVFHTIPIGMANPLDWSLMYI